MFILVPSKDQDVVIWQTSSSNLSKSLEIFRWKFSGAEVMPKGSRWNLYLSNGVMNVVNRDESWDNGTCQKPEFASSLLKSRASLSCAKVSFTDRRICRSLFTEAFNLCKSTQMRTLPFGLGTTTIGAHQSVGCPLWK